MPVYCKVAFPALGHLPPHTADRFGVLTPCPKVEDRDSLQLRALSGGNR
jgi:hypothetical protein